ncbi:MAG: class D sortase [Bryobacteraceae bacterium]
MRLSVQREPLGKILRRSQYALFVAATLALAYSGMALYTAWKFQANELAQFSRRLASTASPVAPPVIPGLVGRVEIERLGVSVIVMEGTGSSTLRRAVGHIEGTALPGQPGNIGLAGHRDSFFRPLRNIQQNDVITLTTLLGEYRYRVLSAKIVPPTDVSVLAPGEGQVLTLVTCYPFYFVGPAPDRFVVRAMRIRS